MVFRKYAFQMTLKFTFVLLVKIISCASVQLLDARCLVICGLLALVVFYHCYFNMQCFPFRMYDIGISREFPVTQKKGDVILLTVPNTARLFALEVIISGFIVILLVRSKGQWIHYNGSFVKHGPYAFTC